MPPIPRTTYAIRQAFPAIPPTIIVVFRGLLSFCFSGNLNCEVGINNQAPTTMPDQTHELNIKIWEKRPNCPVTPTVEYANPPRTHMIELDVHGSLPEVDGAYVYVPNPRVPYNRITPADPKDFRCGLDFEGPDLHNQQLPKFRQFLRPSLNMNNGIFYTRQMTKSKFALRSRAGDRLIGSVPKLVAANIYLVAGGFVDLKIDGVTMRTLSQASGVTYQVDFTNDCTPVAGHCGYDPGNPTPQTRSDFYLNYRTFALPGGAEEFELICTQPLPTERDPELCGHISDETTDPSPCMGILFGQSSGLG